MNKFILQSLQKIPDLTVTTLPNNLIAYWKLDEASGSALDSVGSNTLTADNAPVSTTGQVGSGRAFVAASQQRLKTTSPGALAPGLLDFSISFWFKYTGISGNMTILNWGNQATTNPYLWILLQAGSLRVQFVDGLSGFNTANTSITFTTNVWHQVTCVFDRNALLTIYKNGASAETNSGLTAHQGNFAPATAFALGNYGTSNSLPLDGAMDEVKIWHRAITANEVLADYNNGVAGLPLT